MKRKKFFKILWIFLNLLPIKFIFLLLIAKLELFALNSFIYNSIFLKSSVNKFANKLQQITKLLNIWKGFFLKKKTSSDLLKLSYEALSFLIQEDFRNIELYIKEFKANNSNFAINNKKINFIGSKFKNIHKILKNFFLFIYPSFDNLRCIKKFFFFIFFFLDHFLDYISYLLWCFCL